MNTIEVPFLPIKQLGRDKVVLAIDARQLDDVIEIAEYDPAKQFEADSILIQRAGGDAKWNTKLLDYIGSPTFVGLPSIRAFDTRNAVTINKKKGLVSIDTDKKLVSSDGGGRQRVLSSWKTTAKEDEPFTMVVEVLLNAAPSDGRIEFLNQSHSRKIEHAHRCSLLVMECANENDFTRLGYSKQAKDGPTAIGMLVGRDLNRNPDSMWYNRINENNGVTDSRISDWTFGRNIYHLVCYFLRNNLLKLSEIKKPEDLTAVITPVVFNSWQGWYELCPEIFDAVPHTNARKGHCMCFNFLIPSLYNYWRKKYEGRVPYSIEWVKGMLSGVGTLSNVRFWHNRESAPDNIPGNSRHIGADESTRADQALEFFRNIIDPNTKKTIHIGNAVAPIEGIHKKANLEKNYKKQLRAVS